MQAARILKGDRIMHARVVFLVSVLSAIVLLTAMGGGKGSGFTRAPRVQKNYTVRVTDTSGKTIAGENFSWEGRVHFSGYLGMANVVIPFEKVKELTVGENKDRKVQVTVRLKDGKETSFAIDADARCYGEAGFGSFMLMMDEIRSISFK